MKNACPGAVRKDLRDRRFFYCPFQRTHSMVRPSNCSAPPVNQAVFVMHQFKHAACPDQTASGGIGGFGPKYFSISALLRPKAFFVKSHSRVGRFRTTFRRRSTRFCQYL